MLKGELIEVVDGIEVRARPEPDRLALVEGRRGRLSFGGPLYEVERVGQGAVYLSKIYDPPLIREFGDAAARDEAIEVLHSYLRNRGNDGESAKRLTMEAVRAARAVRKLQVSRGPIEPGISLSARFVERVA